MQADLRWDMHSASALLHPLFTTKASLSNWLSLGLLLSNLNGNLECSVVTLFTGRQFLNMKIRVVIIKKESAKLS